MSATCARSLFTANRWFRRGISSFSSVETRCARRLPLQVPAPLSRAEHLEGPWEKYPHSLVFKPTGNTEDFDGVFLRHACPVLVDDQWHMYYNGWTLNREAKNSLKAEYAMGLAFAKE